MNKEQIRARLAEITARLAEIGAIENMEDSHIEEMNNLNEEFETLDKKLSALERTEANIAKTSTTTRQVAPVATSKVTVGASHSDKFFGFKSTGDFLMAVKSAGSTGKIHQNLQNIAFEKNGEDGGFMVPEELSNEIVKKLQAAPESLWSKAKTFKVAGNSLSLLLDESQPWNNGIQAYWTAEGASITESKAKFTRADWRLHKIAAMVKATDELLDDATALESYIRTAAPDAIMHKVNGAIVSGNGVGKPQGLLNSPFTVTVLKESGQAADTIVARNIIKMYARMFPTSLASAAWYCNAGVVEQLMQMKDDNGNFIYLAPGSQMNQSPYGLLMGRPVIPMLASLPGLGDSGDIVFADLGYYYGIEKSSGVKSATSIHLHFDREITAFRFSLRLDGKVPFQSPVTTEFGNYTMSAFVKLEDRA